VAAQRQRKSAAIGIKTPFPGFVEPALATLVDRVPVGQRWIHEIKFDGYRVQVHLANEAARVFTRRGNDWTKRFKKIADEAWHIKAGSAIVDGEVVVPAADGTTDFAVLQNDLKGRSRKIVLVAFDLLYLNGRDLRRAPLHQRKAELKKIISGTDVQFSESFEIEGREMFTHACKIGLEGVVSEVRDSIYASGRGNNWVKKTCAQRETLAIADLCRQGRPRLRQDLSRRTPEALAAARPQDATLCQAHRTQGHLGRAEAAHGDRVSRQVGRRKGSASFLQRLKGGLVSDAAKVSHRGLDARERGGSFHDLPDLRRADRLSRPRRGAAAPARRAGRGGAGETLS